MKKYIYMSMALAATMFTACSSDDNDIQPNNNQTNNDEGISVYVQLPNEATTRVSYADDSEGSTYSLKPSWESGDNIRFSFWWNNDSNVDEQRTENRSVTIATGEATTNKTPLTDTYVYAYYPVSLTGTIPNSTGDYITFSPARIRYNISRDLTELKAKNILVGRFQYTGSKTSIVNLYNVYALLKFSIKVPTTASALTNITIGTLNGAGNAKAQISRSGQIKYESDGTLSWLSLENGYVERLSSDNDTYGTISLTGDGEYKEAVFYALIIPQTFTNGLYLEVKDNLATPKTYKYLKAESVTLERGYMYGIKAKVAE